MLRYLDATAAGIVGGVIVGVAATWATLLQPWWRMRQTDDGGMSLKK